MQIAERVWQLARPVLVLILALPAAQVATAAEISVPPELRGWEDWALHGQESHRCPWLIPGKSADEDHMCAWPSVLELQVDEHGGHFSQRWEAASETWLALPGSTESWPEEVTLDGKPAAIVLHERTPAVRVAAGAHVAAGFFHWTRRPEFLSLDGSVALVSLSIDGVHVPNARRSDAGIELGVQPVARQEDRAEVRVFRRLADTIPAHLSTEIHLAVSGEAREIGLPAALPEGFQPIAIESALAARLDPDNLLRVQVRPGDFTVTIEARGPNPVNSVRLPQRSAPWPAQEVWSFAADDRLRVVAIEGVAALDPAQANVPVQWRDLPAYRMDSASTLKVIERSRGLAAADGNDLRLERTAWLDFAGHGYTLVDRVSGSMRQDWRLDLKAPYSLRSARAGGGAGEPLLVTSGSVPELSGIELRTPSLDLTAVSRLERVRGAVPATGWHSRFTRVSGNLVTGPGYRLLAAFGPDAAPQAWLERWRLLDIFMVLLTATVAWRMFGVRTALIALAAGVLTYQETDAPTWLWLAVLIALALFRASPMGRLRDWAGGLRWFVIALLVLALVPFAITQVRLAVYPQLEALITGTYRAYALAEPAASPRLRAEGLERHAQFGRTVNGAVAGALEARSADVLSSTAGSQEVVVTADRREAAAGVSRYEPGALVQAGPGVPAWSYHVYPFAWSGPVDENATARFIVSPPWMTRLWRLLGLLLATLFVIELTRRELPPLPPGWRLRPQPALGFLLVGLALLCGTVPAADAATTPDPHLLDQLRTRLLEPPKCSPDCAALLSAQVSATATRLSVMLKVSTLDPVGVALPGAEPQWTPDLVQVDGAGAGWVQRSPAGVRYVKLPPGLHLVRLEGALDGIQTLSLFFPLPPHLIDVHAIDWDVGGVLERRLVSGALELARKRIASAALRQEEFPPFVTVDRLFHLSHEWTIDTTVSRVAPKSAAFTVNLPLLPGEAVTTPGLKSSGSTLSLGLAAGEARQRFSSILPRSDSLELTASRDDPRSERWRFEVAPTWHADFSGLPAVAPDGNGDLWLFEYYPRPGERLKISVTRPAAAAGGTLAFDSVVVATNVGRRSSDTTLELHYRSTQGGRQILRVPADAQVTQVLNDGQSVALRPEHGELSLSGLPGSHTWSVTWRSPKGVRLLARSPEVWQGAPASNLRLSMRLPQDRWVLYAFGPGVGPTLLYWGELLVFLVLAWSIGRSALTPLPARDWLLLGLGLSTFSWMALGLFVLFIALFQWRARHPAPANPRHFRLLQLLSAFIAIVAILSVVAAVPQGLLAYPDMRIEPAGADGLTWFVDQAADRLPTPGVLSISLWWYKLAMLAWALWLSFAVTRWTRWAWGVFIRDGLWPRRPVPAPPPPPAPAVPSEA